MSLKILQPGLFSTVQDAGRYSGMPHGIPISGAMDLNLYQFVNGILNNSNTASCIEFFHQGLELQFSAPTFICVGGLELNVELNGKPVKPFDILNIKPNDRLKIKEMSSGNWGYLAIKNGFQTQEFFRSQSFYEPFTNSRLQKGDNLTYEEYDGTTGGNIPEFNLNYYKTTLEVFKGPEFSKLSRTLQYQLFNAEFSLSSSLNRMAFQIQETLENELEEIVTGPVLPGTIQYTSGGKMIVLMRDAQVTGGYPRILQLSEQAINQLSQARAKSKLEFKLSEINSETT
jgi:allophanate hydrolase subunit 2